MSTYPQPCGMCRTSNLKRSISDTVSRGINSNVVRLHRGMGVICVHGFDPDRITPRSTGTENRGEIGSHYEGIRGRECQILALRGGLVHIISEKESRLTNGTQTAERDRLHSPVRGIRDVLP